MTGDVVSGELPGDGGPAPGAPAEVQPMYPEAIELFYTESKAQADGLWETMKSYRSNATAALALATGAATFFGLADTAKGVLYFGALVFYGLAVLLVVRIYRPTDWLPASAPEFGDALRERGGDLTLDQARYSLARLNVDRYEANVQVVVDTSWLFRLLLVSTALVMLCAGANTLVEKPAVPDKPTRVIIEEQK